MLQQIKYWLIVISMALVVGVAVAITAVFSIARLTAFLLCIPLDATNPINWLLWIVGIAVGIGAIILVFRLWRRQWRPVFGPDKPLGTIVPRVALMGAMIGFAIGVLWFDLGQVGMSLLILSTHGPLCH